LEDFFDCPECSRVHDEPATGAYVLTVLCLDCDLEAQRREVSAPKPRDIPEAA